MVDLHRYPIPEAGVVGRQLEGEAVVVLPREGRVKVLNQVGARIWALADGTRSGRQIVDALCEEFAVSQEQALEDVRDFLSDLAEQGAIRFASEPAGAPTDPHGP